MKRHLDNLIYSPSDLVRFLESPFASWMDRYHLANPGVLTPDELSEDAQLVIEMGNQHELAILETFRVSPKGVTDIARDGGSTANTLQAIKTRRPIIYQAKLEAGNFAGYADFIILDERTDSYQIWDTKLARSPKPYYAIQLCCYSELFTQMTGESMPKKFGIILGADIDGNSEHAEFRTEDFFHYYLHLKDRFLALQAAFDGRFENRPIPDPRADHGLWQTHADKYLDDQDHLVRVAGISTGQIKKLNEAGISTLSALAEATGRTIAKFPKDSLSKLVHQARLQKETRDLRRTDRKGTAKYDILPSSDENGLPTGLAELPPEHPADVFFDMEGYPLMPGGLEYLFGNTTIDTGSGEYEFTDFWAHDRPGEKAAFEAFIDWVYDRWRKNPGMHIYHYAVYEVAAVRRLSTQHDTRQEEVDDLLRHEVFVDLYKIVRRGLRIGEDSYSLKKVEKLYWPESRTGVVTLSIGSVVHYARWIQSNESRDWQESSILKEIRDYNKDDCDSTAELAKWLRKLAADNGIPPCTDAAALRSADQSDLKPVSEQTAARLEIARRLREKGGDVSIVLADLVDFHRRESKPVWWRFFDRAASEAEVLRDDNGCIAEVEAVGGAIPEKRSFLQEYGFDAAQECKLSAGERSSVAFSHNKDHKFNLFELDLNSGALKLKAGPKTLEAFGGAFPQHGSLIPDEFVNPEPIPTALTAVAESHLSGHLNAGARALLERLPPKGLNSGSPDSAIAEAIQVARGMDGDCLVIQGPPGTGKTFTASHMICALLADGKKIGITSNGHKAVVNLMSACGNAVRTEGRDLVGIKVGGEDEGELFDRNPSLQFVKTGGEATDAYSIGVLGGTAWVFARDDMAERLDYLFVDEAGQVPLANVIAMSRCTKNLVLLGDQMQLEQPIQGSHPGDSRLSALQYALKDAANSDGDSFVFHAVVPSEKGLFLGETRRMHPSVCEFISESIYDGRLHAFTDCANQKISTVAGSYPEYGIVFSGVEHDGNIQQSDEEVDRVISVFDDLIGRPYTASDGTTRPLSVSDFLVVAPYNAQVRALTARLPEGARVGSVDKFQGQEAPVCVLSLCSSYGEYGSRGLGFILDRNRINVAISRAQCLAIVVADPRIASANATSIAEMKLINLFCKLCAQEIKQG